MRQKTKEPRNAATVCYFDHLFDSWDLRTDIVPWLPPDVIADCWPLWRLRLTQEQLSAILLQQFNPGWLNDVLYFARVFVAHFLLSAALAAVVKAVWT